MPKKPMSLEEFFQRRQTGIDIDYRCQGPLCNPRMLPPGDEVMIMPAHVHWCTVGPDGKSPEGWHRDEETDRVICPKCWEERNNK